jgi:demethylmenaquinone methyltransferase/2-methoxy-6-polyprenyl-1,4-benzoquinol methylase
MMNITTTTCIRRALEAEPLRGSVLRAAVQALGLPPGSQGLDAGCGVGLQALLLAEVVGPEGRITGLDFLPELLLFASEQVREAGRADRLAYCAGDVGRLPFADDSFDWVWSADCVGYPLGEMAPLLRELARVVRPGGSIFLLGWSSQQLLPGYSLLEARLNATWSGYLPYLQGGAAELNFLRALHPLREAGLDEVRVQTFVGDVQAPLSGDERTGLISLLEMLWGERQPAVTDGDWQEYQRLCQPDSPDFIADTPGYYAFFTYSLFEGKVPGR